MAKKLKLYRTFKEGFTNFYRNGWLTLATGTVMAISLYLIGLTMIVGTVVNNAVIKAIQDRINVSIYFNPDVKEERIMEVKQQLEKYEEIKSVDYVSKDKALDELKNLSRDNESINQALTEIGDNPLLASLVIRAERPDQYEKIVGALENSSLREEFSRINYEKNKPVIEKISGLVSMSEDAGLAVGIVFVVLAVLITFNTIRITIYSHQAEFEVMRLVGASNIYVRMPYIFEGVLYGVTSSVAAFLLVLVSVLVIKSSAGITAGLGELGISFGSIFLTLLSIGVILGVVSSFIAIKRYLKK